MHRKTLAEKTQTLDEAHLTSPGTMLGTVAYMSPEQVRGRELDARSDLFSFGAVLYEMATGDVPFHGESSAVICEAIMNRAPVPAVRLNHDVPARLEDIINKALEKDINLRYQHASEMRSDLQRLKRDTDIGTKPVVGACSQAESGAGSASSGQRRALAASSAATVADCEDFLRKDRDGDSCGRARDPGCLLWLLAGTAAGEAGCEFLEPAHRGRASVAKHGCG